MGSMAPEWEDVKQNRLQSPGVGSRRSDAGPGVGRSPGRRMFQNQ